MQNAFDSDSCRACAEFCTVFSNPVRARILWALREHEQSVTDLAEMAETSVQNVSQHLRLMRDKGAIRSRREGKQVFYAVANIKFLKGMGLIREGLLEEMQKRVHDMSPKRMNARASASKARTPR